MNLLNFKRRRGSTGEVVIPPPDGDIAPVVILAGQSNAKFPNAIHEMYNPYRDGSTSYWKVWNRTTSAFEQLVLGTNNYGYTETNIKGSPLAPLLANLSNAFPDQDVYSVIVAEGATALYSDWLVGGLADDLIETINDAKAAILLLGKTPEFYFVWIQGESDAWAGRTTAQYKADWNTLFTRIKTECDIDTLPTVIPLISSRQGNVSTANLNQIRAAHTEIGTEGGGEILILNRDTYVLRDAYHDKPVASAFIAEESMEFFTGVPSLTGTPQTLPAGHIDFNQSYFEEYADNDWIGGGTNTASYTPVVYYGTGGAFRKTGAGRIMGISDNNVNGVMEFSINFETNPGFATCKAGSTVLAAPAATGSYYRILVSATGDVSYQQSADSSTWTTIASTTGATATYYAKISSTFPGQTFIDLVKTDVLGNLI